MGILSRTILKIPLRYTYSQHLTCVLQVNNCEALFLVDTGASNSCFDKDKAMEFSIEANGEELPMTAASETPLSVRESKKIGLSFNQKPITRLSLMLIDMNTINDALKKQDDPSIDGILGADVLHKKKAIIDYDQCCLIFS